MTRITLAAFALLALFATRPAEATPPSADPLEIPLSLEQAIEDAISACNCFTSITPLEVTPVSTASEVFFSDDVLFAVVGWDIQLPWAARGQVPNQALRNILVPSGQTGLLDQIAAFADPSGHGYKVGAHKWSYMTQPDYCSSETVYLMYFEHTGVLFAFRFDSSSEC